VSCRRCIADPRPVGAGSERRCAFDADGAFTPENWNCATIEALLHTQDEGGEFPVNLQFFAPDESMQIVPDSGTFGGWIILNRYKQRGETSSAAYVGDFWPPEPLTLEIAERVIKGWS
jgi:hypothetical protein